MTQINKFKTSDYSIMFYIKQFLFRDNFENYYIMLMTFSNSLLGFNYYEIVYFVIS